MKIFALVTGTFGERGGIGQANRDLLEALCSDEKITEIITLPRHSSGVPETLPSKIKQCHPIKNQLLYSLYATYVFLKIGKADIIFCGHLFMTPLAFFLGRMFHVPFWVHLYGVDAWRPRYNLVSKAVGFAALVTCISRYTKRMFLSWANFPNEKVRILACTVNERFVPGPKSEKWIKKLNLEGRKIILTVGRLDYRERYKGHYFILKTLPQLLDEFSNLTYVICGDGNDRVNLEQEVHRLKLDKNVRFLGYVEDENLPDIYRLADVFAMPSTGEGFGIVFLEAIASGVPTIATDEDGSVDPLQDGRLGRITTREHFFEDLKAILRQSDADWDKLSLKVLEIFNKNKFSHHLSALLNRSLKMSGHK